MTGSRTPGAETCLGVACAPFSRCLVLRVRIESGDGLQAQTPLVSVQLANALGDHDAGVHGCGPVCLAHKIASLPRTGGISPQPGAEVQDRATSWGTFRLSGQ